MKPSAWESGPPKSTLSERRRARDFWGEGAMTERAEQSGLSGLRSLSAVHCDVERVTGFEPADTSLGSLGLTTWQHPPISTNHVNTYTGAYYQCCCCYHSPA